MDDIKLKKLKDLVTAAEAKINEYKDSGEIKSLAIRRLAEDLTVAKAMVASLEKDAGILERFVQKIDALNGKEFPKSFEVSNLTEMLAVLKGIASKETPEYPTKIEVSNLSEIRHPKEIVVSGLKSVVKTLQEGVLGLVGEIKALSSQVFKAEVTGKVFVTNKELAEAIPVRLASGDLKFFYNAMATIMGSGGDAPDVGLLNQIINAIIALGGTWYDTVAVTYPAGDQEVYTFTLAAATVRVLTVTYTDNTKDDLLSIVRT